MDAKDACSLAMHFLPHESVPKCAKELLTSVATGHNMGTLWHTFWGSMDSKSYTARLDSHPGRPGYLVEFRHPCVLDKTGRYGKKLRRGLGTTNVAEAEQVVADLDA